jgi:hypothetical protein
MKLTVLPLVALGALLNAAPAHAGRPLATDDAGTAEARTCQVESWLERAGSDRAWVLAPACGVVPGLEIGADYTAPHPRDVVRGAAGLALKWVPESWKVNTGAGELNFGIKLNHGWLRPASAGWQAAETGALLLATLKPGDAWTVHANLGTARDRIGSESAALLNLALVWTPSERALLFAESQANNKRSTFGGTVNTAGGRWWLVKDSFGIDLTASREAGVAGPTLWTFGFGWYGLSF